MSAAAVLLISDAAGSSSDGLANKLKPKPSTPSHPRQCPRGDRMRASRRPARRGSRRRPGPCNLRRTARRNARHMARRHAAHRASHTQRSRRRAARVAMTRSPSRRRSERLIHKSRPKRHMAHPSTRSRRRRPVPWLSSNLLMSIFCCTHLATACLWRPRVAASISPKQLINSATADAWLKLCAARYRAPQR